MYNRFLDPDQKLPSESVDPPTGTPPVPPDERAASDLVPTALAGAGAGPDTDRDRRATPTRRDSA